MSQETIRERVGRLIVGPSYNPARSLSEQAVEVWKQGAPKAEAEKPLTEEEREILSTWDLENLSLQEQKSKATRLLEEKKAFRRQVVAVE